MIDETTSLQGKTSTDVMFGGAAVGVSARIVLWVCQQGREKQRGMILLNKIQMFPSSCVKSARPALITAARLTDGNESGGAEDERESVVVGQKNRGDDFNKQMRNAFFVLFYKCFFQ